MCLGTIIAGHLGTRRSIQAIIGLNTYFAGSLLCSTLVRVAESKVTIASNIEVAEIVGREALVGLPTVKALDGISLKDSIVACRWTIDTIDILVDRQFSSTRHLEQ